MKTKNITFKNNMLPISKRKHMIIKYLDDTGNEQLHNKDFYKNYNNSVFIREVDNYSFYNPKSVEGCELLLYNDKDEVIYDEWIYIFHKNGEWKFVDSYGYELVF